ncbi:anti-anti-sigma factor [Amycolatopsis orientalis]|uniref:Anti-sigma factor antagonist n=1 Tax=Amycolatopsis orientalis TaxID=31958 RepID=A0A193C579_AMYOR|nr:STAS domain-containing protein [Amycolatopsis orientalis]ANN19500.1 anti-anti-sigma factor [Amycolatopsis orientalis]
MAFNTGTAQSAPFAVIEADRSDDAVVVEVTGDIDISSSPRFHAKILELLERGPATVVIDLTGVGFCDSSGLSGLLRLHRYCTESGIDLSIAPSKVVRRAIELTGLSSTLKLAG